MSDFHSVVTEQKVYICAVYSFIGKLLRAVLPEVAWNNTCLPSEEAFGGILDAVIQKHDPTASCEGDCCLSMAQTACRQMKRVCELLRNVCRSLGLKDEADQYLDAPWFVDLLLRMNVSKLNKLLYTIDFADDKPSRILMNVAAILNDKAVAYDAMSARAKRKADKETNELIREATSRIEKKIAAHDADTKTQFAAVRDELHETKEELMAKVKAILKKVGKVNFGGKRKCRHTAEQKKVCLALWMEAQRNEELKSGTEKGIATYEAAFNWYKKRLALVDVTSSKKFVSVIRSIISIRSAESIKALEAKIEEERKAKKNNPQTSPLTSSPLHTKKQNVVKFVP